MVIMEMVKELTGEEAFTVHPHEVERRLDVFNPDIFGKAFDDGEELLKNVLRVREDFAHRAAAIGLIDPRIDIILSFQVRRPVWGGAGSPRCAACKLATTLRCQPVRCATISFMNQSPFTPG